MSSEMFCKAERSDIPLLIEFIHKLAAYEEKLDDVVVTPENIEKHMFGSEPKAHAFFAVIDGKEVGFALYFFNFSTFLGKSGIYVEDIFVDEEFRGCGIGRRIFSELARIALENDCGRLNWWVLDWNKPAIDFYLTLGAEPQNEWTVYKIEGKQALKRI
jgi:GNAT superfamily N-acetyltransferase